MFVLSLGIALGHGDTGFVHADGDGEDDERVDEVENHALKERDALVGPDHQSEQKADQQAGDIPGQLELTECVKGFETVVFGNLCRNDLL